MDSDFKAELSGLLVMQTALLTAVAALIRTHPDHTAMQLDMTRVLEGVTLSGTPGSIGSLLSPAEQAAVRDTVEWLGTLQRSRGLPPKAPQP